MCYSTAHGTVRCATVPHGVLLRAAARYSALRHSTLCYATPQHRVVRHATVRHPCVRLRRGVVLCILTIGYATVRHSIMQFGTLRYIMLRYDTAHATAWRNTVQHGTVQTSAGIGRVDQSGSRPDLGPRTRSKNEACEKGAKAYQKPVPQLLGDGFFDVFLIPGNGPQNWTPRSERSVALKPRDAKAAPRARTQQKA